MGENSAGGGGAEVRATVHITRAATGKTETYEVVGRATAEQLQQLIEGENDDSNS